MSGSTTNCRILFVCLGNICRSPMAKGLLKQKVDTQKFHIDSAGLDHYHLGEPPCELTQRICRQNNCIPDHRARIFTPDDFEKFDKIYVMDLSNLRTILRLAGNESQRKKVSLILDELFPGEQLEVPDPYMRGGDMIRTVYELLDKATGRIAEKLNAGEC